MAQRSIKQVVFVALIAAVVISALFATKVTQDKRQLSQELARVEAERAHLRHELTQTRETLEGQATQLTGLQSELSSLQARLEQTEQEISRMQVEQASLRQTNESLAEQLGIVNQQKAELEAKLSSLRELRAAIRAVKQRLWRERWNGWLARIETQRVADHQKLAQGNRGFVVRDGSTTLGASSRSTGPTKLQIRVLEPQLQ